MQLTKVLLIPILLLEAQGFASVAESAQQCEDKITMNVIENCKESCNEFVLDSSRPAPDSCLLAQALLSEKALSTTQFGSYFVPSNPQSSCESNHEAVDCEPLKPGDNYLGGDKNEIIVLTVSSLPFRAQGPGQAIIELETASDIHWWKGICRDRWEILATSGDNHGPKTATMTVKELVGAAFYKAGFLGVHTWRHGLAVEGGFQEGKKYSFFWKKSD